MNAGRNTDVGGGEIELVRRAERDRSLAEISRLLAEVIPDQEAIVDTVAQRTAELLGDGCLVRLLSEDGQWHDSFSISHRDPLMLEVVREVLDSGPLRRSDSLAADVLGGGPSLLVPDIRRSGLRAQKFPELVERLGRLPYESLIVVSLTARGRTLGFLAVSRDHADPPFNADDLLLAEDIGARTALAVDNARLLHAAQQELAERRRADAALRESEARFRTLVQRSFDIIVVIAPDGAIRYVSPSVRRVLGYDPEALVDTPNDALLHPDDRPRMVEYSAAMFRGRSVDEPVQFRGRHADGTWRWLEAVFGDTLGERGIDGVVAVVRDITARRKADEARRRSEEEARASAAKQAAVVALGQRALSGVESGRLCQDAATTMASMLPLAWARVCELLPGGAVLETRGLAAGDDSHETDIAIGGDPREVLDRLISAGDDVAREPDRGVVSLLLGGPSRPYGLLQAAVAADRPLGDDDLLFLRTVAGVLAAAIERGRVEEELRLVVDGVDEYAMFLLDPDGRIATWNSGAERLTGYGSDAVFGEDLAVLSAPAQQPETDGMVRSAVRHGQQRAQIELERAGGTRYPGEVTVTALRNRDGGVHAFSVVIRDLTGWQELEEQLRQSQKMQALGRLVGGIAHDFNNILTVIVGYTETALDQLPAGDPVREDLEHVQTAGERAAALVGQLLAFSRSQVLHPVIVDVNQVLSSVDSLLQRVLGERIQLVIDRDERCGNVRVDRTKLEQVLLNLVINARDAMSGEGRLRVATACGQRDDQTTVALIVEDNGTGMEPEVERRCFEPFFTTKGPGEGTGLGLSTVYGIVSQSGGTVTVDTAPGAGCTIRIDLPAVDEDEARSSSEAKRGLSAGTETLLLVEDEEPVRRLAAQALRRGGYRVLAAADGEEALELARAHAGQIQLLVTDVVMPKVGGRELARRLQADRPGLPVLYLSGYAPDGLLTDESTSEAADFLQKPFSPQHLSTAVRRILDHRRVS